MVAGEEAVFVPRLVVKNRSHTPAVPNRAFSCFPR
jgi:hypothetical protein